MNGSERACSTDLAAEALAAYDRIIGLDLAEVAIDGSQHKAPCGGEGTGPNCTDRGRSGWKWSLATDTVAIPIGIVAAAANRNDCKLVAATLDDIDRSGLLDEIDTLHLDRGYDFAFVRDDCAERGLVDVQIPKCRPRKAKGRAKKKPIPLGLRWPVERTNSWLSNSGQLRRNTDRRFVHRHAQLQLAIAFLLAAKLIDRAHRWSPIPSPSQSRWVTSLNMLPADRFGRRIRIQVVDLGESVEACRTEPGRLGQRPDRTAHTRAHRGEKPRETSRGGDGRTPSEDPGSTSDRTPGATA